MRSNVYIICQQEIYNKLYTAWNKHNLQPDELGKIENFNPDDDILYFIQWSSVKWYDNYPDVDEIMSIIRNYHGATEKGYQFQCAIIGEEVGDIETYESDNGYIYGLYPYTTVDVPDYEEIDEIIGGK